MYLLHHISTVQTNVQNVLTRSILGLVHLYWIFLKFKFSWILLNKEVREIAYWENRLRGVLTAGLKSHGCITNFLTIEGVKALMIQTFVGQSVNERAKGVGKKSTGHKSKWIVLKGKVHLKTIHIIKGTDRNWISYHLFKKIAFKSKPSWAALCSWV